jgi:UDP-2,3-diacylglucosamine pyrophosphatase LpxH
MTETERLLVLSDLHISPPGPLSSFHAGPELAAFLTENARPGTTLVLAGDIFDFLQLEHRPPTLDMPGAPALIARMLDAIAEQAWGQGLFAALRALLDAGSRLVLLPGNHDPELQHPETRALLLAKLGLPKEHPGFTLHTGDAPWSTLVEGRLPVLVGHGHHHDPWNDIRPEAVARALATGAADVALPPGSRLVLEHLNPLKQLRDPTTGKPRFPFVDTLKPESSTVPLVLGYLDWDLTVQHLGGVRKLAVKTFLRGVERALSRGPTLGAPVAAEGASPPPAMVPAMEEWLAEALVAAVPPEERQAKAALNRTLQTMFAPGAPPAPGTLAAHEGLRRWGARRFLSRAALDGAFFDRSVVSAEDKALIDAHLPAGSGPRVVIFGHTHAARHIDLGDGRVYLNTGTWMDLLRLPKLASEAAVKAWLADDEAVKAWLDDLEAHRIEPVRERTYAEVTAGGASLATFSGSLSG